MKNNDDNLTKSILATLAYSDHFHFPLNKTELYRRLISISTSRREFNHQLNSLCQNGKIESSQGYYYLPGRQSLVKQRINNAKISQSKLILANRYANQLSSLPGVVAIYLTGSLAVNNATLYDDIDYMIITAPGRLWLTRFVLTLYCKAFGLKRTSSSKIIKDNNRLCLNLYLAADSLTIPDTRRSLYSAYELIQAVPLFDPHNTYSRLRLSNMWLYHFLPNQSIPNLTFTPHLTTQASLLELLFFKFQHWYMHNKISREYVTLNQAFFHPHNPAQKLLKKTCFTQLTPSKNWPTHSTKKAAK